MVGRYSDLRCLQTPRKHAMSDQPTVFIVDDDDDFRESLSWLMGLVELRTEAYRTASAFLAAYDPDRSGCLLLDVRMPEMGGLDLQDALERREITLPIIFLTGYADVPIAVRALKHGAFEFLEKPVNDQLLLDRVQQAIARDRETRAQHARFHEIRERKGLLSDRERQVLDLLVAGKSNKQVGGALGLSPRTIEVHRSRIMKKMATNSLVELVRMILSDERQRLQV